ncbi:hypothetical protein ASPCADRAFT_210768 [Aspergillus carbonarius ITEM 5010]|uniref:Uncharacterized protein n=1 Tax=Aspergillus carbonarius (strain ITEM 5010) TaxID=602072 RepID=A0A1R3RBG2_ASPC5|nr:hypothetical protein ASPCADRAFT_210768 [Aspergillus carbonarius ITEM 5010]
MSDFIPHSNTRVQGTSPGKQYDVIVMTKHDHLGSEFWTRAIPKQSGVEIENTEIKSLDGMERQV